VRNAELKRGFTTKNSKSAEDNRKDWGVFADGRWTELRGEVEPPTALGSEETIRLWVVGAVQTSGALMIWRL
jgi:hypothetical protein